MDRGCIYPFLFHIEIFLGTRAENMFSPVFTPVV